jgi:hypothetical protein
MDVLAFQCFQAALDLKPGYRPALEAIEEMRANGRIPPEFAGRAPSANPDGAAKP